MLLLVEKITQLKLGWNVRPLSEADFFALCRRNKITVTEMPLRAGGFYYRVKGRDFIAIDSRLTGHKKLAVMFHEIGHFLFHVPESGVTANFLGLKRESRMELEAELFALCAVMPRNAVENRTAQELIDDGFSPSLVADRFEIFERYGF